MLLLLVHTVLFQIITYALVGPALHLTPILYLRDVITLMALYRYEAMPEPHRARPATSGQKLATWFAPCLSVVSCPCPRFFSSFWTFVHHLSQSMQTPLSAVEDIGWQWMNQTPRQFLPLRVLLISTNTTFGTLCLELLFHVQVGHSWKHISMKSTWGESPFLVILLLMCYVTKWRFIVLTLAPFGIIAFSESSVGSLS